MLLVKVLEEHLIKFKTMENSSFNDFCQNYCDNLYTPGIPDDEQSTGYKNLLKMVNEGIEPATLNEIKIWEKDINIIFETPSLKYLRFLHPNLRPFIIDNWDLIKKLKIK